MPAPGVGMGGVGGGGGNVSTGERVLPPIDARSDKCDVFGKQMCSRFIFRPTVAYV